MTSELWSKGIRHHGSLVGLTYNAEWHNAESFTRQCSGLPRPLAAPLSARMHIVQPLCHCSNAPPHVTHLRSRFEPSRCSHTPTLHVHAPRHHLTPRSCATRRFTAPSHRSFSHRRRSAPASRSCPFGSFGKGPCPHGLPAASTWDAGPSS